MLLWLRPTPNPRLERTGMRGWLCAASAGRGYAPAALLRPWWAAAQLHR
jgi:hypothetical protein